MTRRLEGRRLLFATQNAGKLEEMRQLLEPHGIEIVSSAELGLAEPAETEDTFVGNARIKAHSAASATGLPALADDSGLCVDALGGAPGVYTADWAEVDGARDFAVAMARTRKALAAAGAAAPWVARFQCVLVLAWPDGHDEVFTGSVVGELVWPIRGADGHGYDPMFAPEARGLTFAEMSPEEKNKISHRARALEMLLARCFT